jgi:steroid 5-alpha reductase family enzyme
MLYDAQRRGALATTGPYAYVRHPQYVGFILVMFGFLLQMADAADARDVPCARLDVRPPRPQRGGRG